MSSLKILCLVLDPKDFSPLCSSPKFSSSYFLFRLVVHFELIFGNVRSVSYLVHLLWPGSSWQCSAVSLPSDIYIYAVLVCCVGILSVLLFTLTIIWQSVFSKRKSRGKQIDKVMSGMGALPNHRQAEDAGQSITLFEKCIMSQGLFTCDWWVQRVRSCVSLRLC